ncbi:hypothetical protein ACFR9U_14530 [Halorientalis brevis]|uniref:CAAX protease self-immunity n=1 Tax=Halorientalis brevis TaxID=1126241 RepID=A0ABD6CD57_9EURY|nr:hypothetical protein [Halorientalis brevis]
MTVLRELRTDLHHRWEATTLGFGVLFVALVGIQLWKLLVMETVQVIVDGFGLGSVPMGTTSALVSLVGPGLGALVYVRYRKLDLGTSRPRNGTWPIALAVIFAPALLAAAVSAVGNAMFGVSLSAITQQWVSPQVSAEFVLLHLVQPDVFRGIGEGLLICGVIYESVRSLVGDDDATGLAALCIGYYWLMPWAPIDTIPPSLTDSIVFAMTVLLTVAFGVAVGVLYQTLADTHQTNTLSRRHIPVFGVAFVSILSVTSRLTTFPHNVHHLLWIPVLGLAVLGYARTRSVWVAVLSLVAYQVAVHAIVLVEATLGLAVV